MTTDPFASAEWRAYAAHAHADLVPKLRDSFATISLVPEGETDIKFALELGLSIMMDKPIIAVIAPGTQVPAKLLAVADAIIEGDPTDHSDPERSARFNARLGEALQVVLADLRAREDDQP